jgi:hypothetical protein
MYSCWWVWKAPKTCRVTLEWNKIDCAQLRLLDYCNTKLQYVESWDFSFTRRRMWGLLSSGVRQYVVRATLVDFYLATCCHISEDYSYSNIFMFDILWIPLHAISWLRPCTRRLREMPILRQFVVKFPAFYCAWKSMTMFAGTSHWTVSWARWIWSKPCSRFL